MLSFLVCLHKRTLTGILCCAGQQHNDWSAHYRLYSKQRVDEQAFFNVAKNEVQSHLQPNEPMVVAMDDSLFRKTGKHIHGVKYLKDPLGPPFNINFILGQRVLQLSAAVRINEADVRMIPIDFQQAPMPKKPSPKASEQEQETYKELCKQANINTLGVRRIAELRAQIDNSPTPNRQLIMCVDGRFTNRTVLKSLPHKTILIGRIRKDTKLNYLPKIQPGTGRKRGYGDDAPTPEALRQDDSIAYKKIKAFAAGKWHQFKVKVLTPLRWRKAGQDKDMKLVVIAPLGYRLRKGSRILYRQPAYLICTDVKLALSKIIQYYIWRWDIEVNFREQKSLLQIGKAQVRTQASTQALPAMQVASYSLLLLAAIRTYGKKGLPASISLPKWREKNKPRRMTTSAIINEMRMLLWSGAIQQRSLYRFKYHKQKDKNCQKHYFNLPDALFSAVA